MTKRLFAVGALALIASSGWAQMPNKCQGSKIKAAGKKAACLAGLHAKACATGVSIDSAKITKCEAKVGVAFAKLEGKLDCDTHGDAGAIETKVDNFVADLVADLCVVGSGSLPSKCQSAKIKGAGKKAACLAGLDAKVVGSGATLDPAKVAKCKAKVDAAFAKLEGKGGCNTSGDAGAIETKVDDFVDDLLDVEGGCAAAGINKRSVGCHYFATSMDVSRHGDCFAAVVANTWPTPAHISVKFQGLDLPVEDFTRIPSGAGGAMSFGAFDATAGLGPGEVAVLFLGGTGATGTVTCPVIPAVGVSSFAGTGLGSSFEIATDVPVVAYQINPFGVGTTLTGASLLLPTTAWGTSYIAVNAFPQGSSGFKPSLNIVAAEDSTTVTIVPVASVVGGNGIPAGTTGQPMQISLAKGQHAQITQTAELTGSVVTSNKPVGLMAGQPCMNVPIAVQFCDHGEQMIPPVSAIGHQYAAVMYRPRAAGETQTIWRIVGVVNGTQLSYSTAVGGPPTLTKGEVAQFVTGTPFTVASQDADHPFMLFAYMTGGATLQPSDQRSDLGDPDFVLVVPPDQYLSQYVFFSDPTYPEADLVVVRKRDTAGNFQDVALDCAGTLTGWEAIGTDFEFTRVDLTTGNFQNVGSCAAGRREMSSEAPFGLWVWGWGSAATTPSTRNTSYGYPGGMSVQPINSVIF